MKGTITSPSYPKWYPSDVKCTYVISVPENQRVELKFIDLDVEGTCFCINVPLEFVFCGSYRGKATVAYAKPKKRRK